MKKEFFIENRKNYLEKIEGNSMTILFSGCRVQRSADQDYPFEVNKNFFYLTGIKQDNVILVLIKGKEKVKEFLFIEPNNEALAKWIGSKLSVAEVKELSGIEKIFYIGDFDQFIYNHFNSTRNSNDGLEKLYLDLERRQDKYYQTAALRYQKEFVRSYPEIKIKNAYLEIIGLRMIKKDEEVQEIKKAIKTTKFALEKVMNHIEGGMYEYQLESYFEQYIMHDGQKSVSFETICGSGKNAATLHYVANNSILKDGEMVLMDLGCRGADFYISDITRTYPIGGTYQGFGKKVYEAVLRVNKACIEYLKPGITWEEYNEYARDLLAKECIQLGLIKERKELTKYYWHSIGHFTGLDTHDPGIHTVPLKAGMVLTVEPGLYVEEKGVGVRIEDNVLITKTGAVNLSKDIIKEVCDIENFMKKD